MPRNEPEPHTRSTLSTIASRAEAFAATLRQVVAAMESINCECLMVPGHKSMVRGLRWCEDFGQNAEQEFARFEIDSQNTIDDRIAEIEKALAVMKKARAAEAKKKK